MNRVQGLPLQLTGCPACGACAEIEHRSVLESTDGPIEHVKLRCVNRHWFMAPVAVLDRPLVDPSRPSSDVDGAAETSSGHGGQLHDEVGGRGEARAEGQQELARRVLRPLEVAVELVRRDVGTASAGVERTS